MVAREETKNTNASNVASFKGGVIRHVACSTKKKYKFVVAARSLLFDPTPPTLFASSTNNYSLS